jgi:bacteriocin-like protein
MSDENKEPMVDQKKGAEDKTQLSEEALSNVSGGEEVIKFKFGAMQVEYQQQKAAD